MPIAGNWHAAVKDATERLKGTVSTQAEFEAVLRHLLTIVGAPIDAVDFDIASSEPFANSRVGCTGEGQPTYLHTHDLDPHGWARCTIRLWMGQPQPGPGAVNTAAIYQDLTELLRAYWKPELRDDKSRLISLQYPATNRLLDEAIERGLAANPLMCVFFCDLDRFKQVNERHGELAGDAVILQFSSILAQVTPPNAVPIHRSGDEYVILLPTDSADQAVLLAYHALHSVETYAFKHRETPIEVPVQASAGIVVLESAADLLSYNDAEGLAEKALKPHENGKNRGTARIRRRNEGAPLPPEQVGQTRELAVCVTKTSVTSRAPFSSPWLNTISRATHETLEHSGVAGLPDLLTSICVWMQPNWSPEVCRSASPSGACDDLTPTLSVFDVGMAVVHGMLRGYIGGFQGLDPTLSITLRHSNTPTWFEVVQGDGTVLAALGDERGDDYVSTEIGYPVLDPLDTSSDEAAHRALLIKIGYQQLSTPKSVFAETIIIDDRPTGGGGLPDFWEATIARLIAHVNRNGNIGRVYVLGNPDFAKETIRRLQSVKDWQHTLDVLAYKTGMPAHAIRTAAERLDGAVVFPANEEALILDLATLLRQEHSLLPVVEAVVRETPSRFLERLIQLDAVSLCTQDGCRVRSVAQAFPVAVEIARKASEDDTIKDRAGLDLKDLMDFKVHLTHPSEQMVPVFYSNEADSLDAYFRREFLDPEGLFGSRFLQNDQLDAVLKHVTSVLNDPSYRFATRRAILIIPHEINPANDLSPLGLVSVRIIPRFRASRILLHYSYSWRTVEALVGFPYSLYASVRYSQHLTDTLRGRISAAQAKRVELGEISYIAHSLHLFMDDYGESIARRIVDEASY